jgi:SAM-dependent methyltransferase
MYRRLVAAPSLFLHLARGRPVSQRWGYDRGLPVDRYYIERFLDEHRADIAGRVLEVKSDDYARRFGDRVTHIDVLDIDSSNPNATIVADLASADSVPEASFDCVVLTQTLQYVYDVGAALRQVRRILRPGGVLLATAPSVSRMSTDGTDARDYWRFTAVSCLELVRREFGDSEPLVRAYGNVLTCTAFLAGLATEELPPSRLDAHDPAFPLVVAFRAVRA